MSKLFVLLYGRTPELSRLEAEALSGLFGYRVLRPLTDTIDLVEFTHVPGSEELKRLQDRLAGTTRIAKVFAEQTTKLLETIGEFLTDLPPGKVELGLSCFSSQLVSGTRDPRRLASQLKHGAGRSLRTITPQVGATQLDAAQLLFNGLGKGKNKSFELCIIEVASGRYTLAQTITCYDMIEYTKRDRGVPAIDAYTGVLPPRLAQTVINLAVRDAEPATTGIYDAFCGNGRILLEAARWGFTVSGSDIEEKQVRASLKNIDWSNQHLQTTIPSEAIFVADARKLAMRPDNLPTQYYIVSEPFMGKPLRQPLKLNEKEKWSTEILSLLTDFARSLGSLPVGQRPQAIVILAPAAQAEGGEVRTAPTFVDRLGKIGYDAQVLADYRRPDSFVRREILRLTYR